ncbi:MAG: [acyl-carrier-protein] S-malonyltransferase [Anaerolineae bacterium]|jgi:[acyl-carrier-protein] S-malonyltransferase|nr:MAG: [acyl-carrier-protein] S-malonyltransferase [Anaerolineae bacterium]
MRALGQIAILFPGQGSQQLGMGATLANEFEVAQETFIQADAQLGYPLSEICWQGPLEKLNDTYYTQPALYTHSIAAWRVFKMLFPDLNPLFFAGHSMGQITALAACEAVSFEDGLTLAAHRGRLMKESGEQNPGGMAAILGLDAEPLHEICQQVAAQGDLVQVANDNCPGQIVISGSHQGVTKASELALSRGAKKAIKLAVSIAAHSQLMAPAQVEFSKIVDRIPFEDPKVPLVGNVCHTAMSTKEQLKDDIKAQLTSPVYWTDSVRYMIENGVQCFIELGSGSVLSGLIKRIDPNVQTYALGTAEDFAKFSAV